MAAVTYPLTWAAPGGSGLGGFAGSRTAAFASSPVSGSGQFDQGYTISVVRYDLSNRGALLEVVEGLHPPLSDPHPFNEFDDGGQWACRKDKATIVFFFTVALRSYPPYTSTAPPLNPLWALVVTDDQRYALQHVGNLGPLLGIEEPTNPNFVIRNIVGYGDSMYALCNYLVSPPEGGTAYRSAVVRLAVSAQNHVTITGHVELDTRMASESATLLSDGRIAFTAKDNNRSGQWGYLDGLSVDIRRVVADYDPEPIVAATDANTAISGAGYLDADMQPLGENPPAEPIIAKGDGHYFLIGGLLGTPDGSVDLAAIPAHGRLEPYAVLQASGGFRATSRLFIGPDGASFLGDSHGADGAERLGFWGAKVFSKLRLNQRNDGRGIVKNPRLRASNGTSTAHRDPATARVGVFNRLDGAWVAQAGPTDPGTPSQSE